MPTEINELSVKSLLIGMLLNDTPLSSGTGFIATSAIGPVLITNRHNVTGRRQDNGQPLASHGGVPNRIGVWHNGATLGQWVCNIYPLYDDHGEPKWKEHPTRGTAADFVALPVDLPAGATSYPYGLGVPEPDMLLGPADVVSVIGFPFGQAAGGLFAIWATGFVASEPDIDYNNLPIFLIDCRSRPGQSGSPVVASRNAGMVPLRNGNVSAFTGHVSNFLGIYSGRINEQSDIGIVWKRTAIAELVNSLAPGAT
jgi:hypothetical protein